MHANECALACISADPQAARGPAQAVVDLSRQYGVSGCLGAGNFCLRWASYHGGDRAAGLADMRDAMAICREQEAIFMPNYVFLLAEAEALSGEVEIAIARVVDQLAEISHSGQLWLEAELHRRHSELLLQRAPPDEPAAERAFTRALAAARGQQARIFELRASRTRTALPIAAQIRAGTRLARPSARDMGRESRYPGGARSRAGSAIA